MSLEAIRPEHFIGGAWRPGGAERLPAEDPSTGAILGEIADGGAAEVDAAVEAARLAHEGAWGALSPAERGRALIALRSAVEAETETLARIEAEDVGKPLRQARADAVALARYLEFYAGACDKFGGESLPYAADYTVFTLREPHGVTGHIIPWNYPMQIIGRSVVAALAAGNAAVVKPSEEASRTALAFAALAARAGLPPGAVNLVTGRGETAGAALAAHAGVDHVSFTGSFEVGAAVQAAAARRAGPVTLELGGKSPQVVFADADLDAALPVILNAGLQNAGQTCSAGSRVLVERRIYDAVVARLAAAYRRLAAGPAIRDPDIGPLISARQKRRVEDYLETAGREGLALAACGAVETDAPGAGHYLAPRLYADVPRASRLFQEEIFGPVQVASPFEDEAEAIALANATPYGLAAGVWTRDGARQLRLARRIRAGQVFVNTYGAGGGVELPFGGVGRSGHGREKGFEALFGFTTLKTVAVRHG